MADFNTALPFVLDNEGRVITNTPGDAGGETCWGIARNAWPHWIGWTYVDSGGEKDPSVIGTMVSSFYWVNFWLFDALNSQRIATKTMDMCVNLGKTHGIIVLQEAAGTSPDGDLGPITIGKVNSCDETLLFSSIVSILRQYYLNLVAHNPNDAKFLAGWLNRAAKG